MDERSCGRDSWALRGWTDGQMLDSAMRVGTRLAEGRSVALNIETKESEMNAVIHRFESTEPLVKPNAFIVETETELVIVDTALTMSDSKALKQRIDRLRKPMAGILYTHAHPDHVT